MDMAMSNPMTSTASLAPLPPDGLEVELTAKPDAVTVLGGAPTQVYRYEGRVIQGDAAALQVIPDSYVGPILRAHKGQHVRVHLHNQLPVETNIHWHGLIVPSNMDGHPHDLAAPGGEFVYDFEIRNRAGTYWFHPHKHGETGAQVNKGLAALFIVSDDEEQKLELPSGNQDLALVIQDRRIDADNQFAYSAGSMAGMGSEATNGMGGGMMDGMMGFLGDHILVNGKPNAVLPLATRAYRLRLLNGSNARIYKLAWSDGRPMTVLGTDGGLLAQPDQRPYVALSPGERIELWADFGDAPVGTEVKLQSLEFTAGMDMMGRMGGTLPNGAAFDVLTVRVERQEQDDAVLPKTLVPLPAADASQASNAAQPRPFVVAMTAPMLWTINGRIYEMDNVGDDERVKFGSTEIWEFANVGGMGMGGRGMNGRGMGGMAMAHPMHVHGVQFRIVSRQVDEPQRAGWETLSEGFVDEGWKDTVLVMPGERAQVLMKFADYAGLFMYHCHILEHADMGMMRDYIIEE
jgi:blue copper oxidase